MKRNIFVKNPTLLQEMLGLRRDGWSLPALAIKYQVDHSSIRYWCVVHKIDRPTVLTVINEAPPKPQDGKPKSYKDYVREYNRRHPDHPLRVPNKQRDYIDLPGLYSGSDFT